MADKNGTIRMSLELSAEANAKLEELARKAHTSKSEVLRRSLGFYDVALEAKEGGNKVGIADKDRKFLTEIIGF